MVLTEKNFQDFTKELGDIRLIVWRGLSSCGYLRDCNKLHNQMELVHKQKDTCQAPRIIVEAMDLNRNDVKIKPRHTREYVKCGPYFYVNCSQVECGPYF